MSPATHDEAENQDIPDPVLGTKTG